MFLVENSKSEAVTRDRIVRLPPLWAETLSSSQSRDLQELLKFPPQFWVSSPSGDRYQSGTEQKF